MVVPATRSARAIDGGEDGNGTYDRPLNLAKSRRKWSLEFELREEKILTSVARAFHRTPHVHRR